MKKTLTPEANLLSVVTTWLSYSQFRAQWWRVSLGPVVRGGGREPLRFTKNAMMGFPDLCIVSVRRPGHLYTIELKSPVGRLSPAQVQWQDKLQACGVRHAVIRSLAELIDTLTKWEAGDQN